MRAMAYALLAAMLCLAAVKIVAWEEVNIVCPERALSMDAGR